MQQHIIVHCIRPQLAVVGRSWPLYTVVCCSRSQQAVERSRALLCTVVCCSALQCAVVHRSVPLCAVVRHYALLCIVVHLSAPQYTIMCCNMQQYTIMCHYLSTSELIWPLHRHVITFFGVFGGTKSFSGHEKPSRHYLMSVLEQKVQKSNIFVKLNRELVHFGGQFGQFLQICNMEGYFLMSFESA